MSRDSVAGPPAPYQSDEEQKAPHPVQRTSATDRGQDARTEDLPKGGQVKDFTRAP